MATATAAPCLATAYRLTSVLTFNSEGLDQYGKSMSDFAEFHVLAGTGY